MFIQAKYNTAIDSKKATMDTSSIPARFVKKTAATAKVKPTKASASPNPYRGAFIGPADRANAHTKRSQGSKSHKGREEAHEVSIQVGTQQTGNQERGQGDMKHQKGRCG